MIQLAYISFLAGGALVLIPLILHLLKRRPSEPYEFPSFLFLRATVAKRQNKNNIWKWLVLLLRVLIIAAICLGFAWPFISDVAPKTQEARVILWDSSFSMSARPWKNEMSGLAEEVINLAGPKSPMIIGLVGDRTRWSGKGKFCGDKDKLMKWFRGNSESRPCSSSFLLALKQAETRLKTINCKFKEIVIVTDRQELPWQRINFKHPLAPGIGLKVIGPANKSFANCAVTEVLNDSVYSRAGIPLKISAVLRNYSKEKFKGTVSAAVTGYSSARESFILKPDEVLPVKLKLMPLSVASNPRKLEPLAGKVEISCGDDVTTDNVRYFAVNPSSAFKQAKLSPLPDSRTDFIGTALMPGASESDYKKMIFNGSSSAGLDEISLIVLRKVKMLERNYRSHVETFLKNGGSVAVIVDNERETAELLKSFGVTVKKRKTNTTYLSLIDYEHPVFKPYTRIKSEGWFTIMFKEWFELGLPPGAMVLARFSHGEPAIAEISRDGGRVFVIATDIKREATDWPTNATFLPFWRELPVYAGVICGKRKKSNSLAVSCAPMSFPSDAIVVDAQNKLMADKGAQFIPDTPGCFKIITSDDSSMFCVNPPVSESETVMVPKKFDDRIAQLCKNETIPPEKVIKTEGERMAAVNHPDNRSWWWSLIAAAFIMMVFEMLIANRTAL